MQIDRKDYNPEIHDIYKALSVKQPYADLQTKAVWRDDSGMYHAEKTIEVRSRNTTYRGDLLICASAKPEIDGHLAGVTCGFVELYDVLPVSEFTEYEWEATCIPMDKRPFTGFGWLLRNPRRVIEMPIKGNVGFYNLIVPKGYIEEYPRNLVLDYDGWREIQKRLGK